MLAVGPLVLALLTSATPAPVASTYDQAACAGDALHDSDRADAPDADEIASASPADCETPAPPAIIDCNDPGMSPWVADMIGSCDMPKPPLPKAVPPTTVHGANDGPGMQRLCDGLHCNHESYPLRAASTTSSDGNALALSRVGFLHHVTASPLALDGELEPPEAPRSRLERPPRA